jgi:uncharacterized repeat protein (TIGR03806 family)
MRPLSSPRSPRSPRTFIGLSALCVLGVLAPIACSNDALVQQPPGATAGGAAGTAVTGNGGTNNNPAGGNSTTTGGSAVTQGGTAGAPAMPATCPECVDFGLDARPMNTTCLAGDPPPTAYKFSRIWSGVTFSTALDVVPHPDGVTMVVAQKNGVVIAVPKDPAATQAQTHQFLNLTPNVYIGPGAEGGLLSLAFDPAFTNNGFVYAVYTRKEGADAGVACRTRVARFHSADGGKSLDLASELKIWEHTQVRDTHHGGDLKFGPDGFLYVSFGDNNTGDDHTNFTAALTDTLYGKLIRIDVNGATAAAPYKIPADNPFADGTKGRPEIFARGLRNPWRFSFDKGGTHEIWLADPGEESNGIQGADGKADPYERVNRVVKGGFYGWPYFQGTHCYHDCDKEKGLPPEYEFSHNGNPTAVVGGFVYRGIAIPGLVGKYVFGEYETGETWFYDTTTKMRQSLGFGGKLVAFGEDHDGELYAALENGQIEKLGDSNTAKGGFPDKLSATGCVSPADAKLPATGMVPFSVALPFWSDGAEKERFLALPEGKMLDIGADGDMTLPVGGVTMKNFRHGGKLFETRFFVHHNDGSYNGYSYEWNADQTDATLVPQVGKDAMIDDLAWTYPSRTACFTCHSEAAGRSLGLETRQLNFVGTYGTKKANQFNTLMHIGMLPPNSMLLAPFPAKDDMTAPVETRARAYLAANCSNCHRPNGPGRGRFNALFDTKFADMNICNQAPEQGDLGVAGAMVIKPGAHASSVLWLRMSQRMMNFMPPIASKIPDQVGADLLASWIDATTACQ